MEKLQNVKNGLELKTKIEELLKQYEATLYYGGDDGETIYNIAIFKSGQYDLDLNLTDCGDLFKQ